MKDNNKGRINQRMRTRKDILDAAGKLLKEGKHPTIEDVAEEAMVSRATAYRYFPNIESLLAEAPVHYIFPDIEELLSDNALSSPEDRVDKAEAAIHDIVYKNETPLRIMLLNSLKHSLEDESHKTPLRQSRRIAFIESALEPVRNNLKDDIYKELLAVLCLFFGTESMIVFRDVYPIDKNKARKVKRWAIRSLVRTALEESKQNNKESGK